MKKFYTTIDKKYTVWDRTTAVVEAESLDEAKEKLRKFANEGFTGEYGINPADVTSEVLLDTMEPMSLEENYASSEYVGRVIIKDIPKSDMYSVEYFEDILNYELTE